MLSKLLDIALGVISKSKTRQFELFAKEETRLNVEAKDGKIETFERSKTAGLSIRILNENRMGFSYCTEASKEAVEQCLNLAIDGARESSPDELYSLTPPTEKAFPLIKIYDHKMSEIDEKEKINRALSLEQSARNYDRRIVQTHRAGYGEVDMRARLYNSLGLDVESAATRAYCQILAIAAQDNEQEMGAEFDSSSFYDSLDIERVGRDSARRAVDMLGARSIPSIRCSVVFEPTAAADMIDFVSSSFLSENVLKQKSMLAGKLGKQVFSPLISIMDDGLMEGGPASFPFDGEGSPSQTTPVVQKGQACRYLFDRYHAQRMGGETTGNSRRSAIAAPPTMGVTNFFVLKGETDASQLISEVSKILVVTDLMGMHTANPVTGEFSLGASGFWFEKGEKVHPVKGIALAGNIIELLAMVDGVGNDLRFFENIGSPSLRVEMLDISGL